MIGSVTNVTGELRWFKKVQEENKEYTLSEIYLKHLAEDYRSQLNKVLREYPRLYHGTLG